MLRKVSILLSILILVTVILAPVAGCDSKAPAEFAISSLQITPTDPVMGETVVITVDIYNSGDLKGSYALGLRINGATVETKSVTLPGGGRETAWFSASERTPGSYTVDVDGLTGTFLVRFGGIVFEDLDGDGSRGGDEKGVPDVLVSNGLVVTVTDQAGRYALPSDSSIVFMTTPYDYTPTGPWYRSASDKELDFALEHAPQKATSKFSFVQMTDIHLDIENLASFDRAIQEINTIAPAFVVATGDLSFGSDRATVSQAKQWFDAYEQSISVLQMPIYNALGNHDVVGIHNAEVPDTDPGYGEEMYRSYFGPTYYSFDWGQYHCIVLNPNQLADGQQLYFIPDSQLEWLRQDLSFRQESPLLVFFHEPTTSWESQSQVLGILAQHQAAIFSGHLHQDILMNTQGIPEQVTGALCGEWWFGPCPDGKPQGYRIVAIDGDDMDTFYKGMGSDREISLDLPGPVVSGEVKLIAKIYSDYGSIIEASYQIDGGETIAMHVEGAKLWATATALWDACSVAEGYHTITVQARDGGGIFNKEVEIKVGENETVPVGELVAHFGTYQGWFTSIEGIVQFAAIGPPLTAEGMGGIKLSDGTGEMIVFAGECKSPALPHLSGGERIKVKAVPLRFSWDFLTVAEEGYFLMAQIAFLIPHELLEIDAEGQTQAIRVMRLLSSSDMTILSP